MTPRLRTLHTLAAWTTVSMALQVAAPGLHSQDLGAPTQDAAGPPIVLPDSRAAKVWAAVAEDTEPAPAPADLAQLLARDGFERAATWARWARLVQAEAAAEKPDPERRTQLCLLAAAHGRAGDAWRHFESLGASPAWIARTLPYLVPGIPADAPVGPGGTPGPLAAGVVLRPLVPPTSEGVPSTALEWRSARLPRLRVGDAVLDFTLAVESSGVQVDLSHVGGGASRLSVVLPEPEGWDVRVEYVDWIRSETLHEPLALEVKPGEEPHSLYGRILEGRSQMPTARPRKMPQQMRTGGLELVVGKDDPQRALFDALAGDLSELLEIEVRVAVEGEPLGSWTGTRYHLLPAGRTTKLRALASSVEGFLLAR